jgi:ligand-binding sensor domain-containing protein
LKALLNTGLITLVTAVVFGSGCDKLPTSEDNRGPDWRFYTTSNSPLAGDTVNAIYIDRQNNAWIATTNGANGLVTGGWLMFLDSMNFVSPFGLSRNVSAIVTDRSGNVWFGLFGGGVRRYARMNPSGDRWERFSTPTLSSDQVHALAVAADGAIWVGTASGVDRYTPYPSDPSQGTWFAFGPGNSPLPNEIIRVIRLNVYDNQIWFGTATQGVVAYDGDVGWDIASPNDLPLPFVSIAFSGASDIWFGTYADWAYRFSASTYEWTQVADSLSNNFVNAIDVDRTGAVWFGTNRGLTRLKQGSWHTFTAENSELPSDSIRALAVDGHNNLWIGTQRGIAIYNEEGTLF